MPLRYKDLKNKFVGLVCVQNALNHKQVKQNCLI